MDFNYFAHFEIAKICWVGCVENSKTLTARPAPGN